MNKTEFNNYLKTEVYKFVPQNYIINVYRRWRQIHLVPSARACYFIRKMQYHASQNGKINQYLSQIYHIRLVKDFACYVSPTAQIDLGLHLPHPTGIVIGAAVIIGKTARSIKM